MVVLGLADLARRQTCFRVLVVILVTVGMLNGRLGEGMVARIWSFRTVNVGLLRLLCVVLGSVMAVTSRVTSLAVVAVTCCTWNASVGEVPFALSSPLWMSLVNVWFCRVGLGIGA